MEKEIRKLNKPKLPDVNYFPLAVRDPGSGGGGVDRDAGHDRR